MLRYTWEFPHCNFQLKHILIKKNQRVIYFYNIKHTPDISGNKWASWLSSLAIIRVELFQYRIWHKHNIRKQCEWITGKSHHSVLPFQAKDAVENAVPCISTLEDKHTAQDIEVQLIFWDWAHHSGLQEGGPLLLQGPLTPPVILHTGDGSFNKLKEQEEKVWRQWGCLSTLA